MVKTKRKKVWLEWVRILLLIVLAGILFMSRDKMHIQREYPFMTVSRANFSQNTELLVIDQGKAAIEIVENRDDRNVLRRTMYGESLEGFYNAQTVAGAPDTGLYISDIGYDSTEAGEMVVHERVVELQNGSDWRVVADFSALMRDGTLSTGGSIYDLQVYDNAVWYLRHENDALNLYRFVPGGAPGLMRSVPCSESLSGASIDLSTGLIATAAHRGVVALLPEGAEDWIDVPKDGEHLMCFDVAARAGELYFSDLYSGRVCRVTEMDSDKPGIETVFEGEGPLYALSLSDDARTILVSDGMAFYRITDGEANYISEAEVSWFEISVLLWICLAAAAALLLYELRGLPRWVAKQLRKESGLRIFLVLAATLIVSAFVIFSLMTELFTREDDIQISHIELFTDLMISKIDPDALSKIHWEDDYGSADYEAIRNVLDSMILTSYHNNQYYYYILYGLSENAIRYLVNYEDSVICGEPVSEYGTDYYSDVFDKGERFTIRTQDSYGNWINTVAPVYGEDGTVAAALEVGMDLGYQTAQRQESALNIILSVICSTVVVVMLLMELLFLLSFSDRKKALVSAGQDLDGPQLIPLRTLIFCSFLSGFPAASPWRCNRSAHERTTADDGGFLGHRRRFYREIWGQEDPFCWLPAPAVRFLLLLPDRHLYRPPRRQAHDRCRHGNCLCQLQHRCCDGAFRRGCRLRLCGCRRRHNFRPDHRYWTCLCVPVAGTLAQHLSGGLCRPGSRSCSLSLLWRCAPARRSRGSTEEGQSAPLPDEPPRDRLFPADAGTFYSGVVVSRVLLPPVLSGARADGGTHRPDLPDVRPDGTLYGAAALCLDAPPLRCRHERPARESASRA